MGTLLLGLATASTLPGQLSPGPLSAPHAGLDGSGHCLACHEQSRGVDPAACLECHSLLRERLDAGAGFHAHLARTATQTCETCHIEHQGQDFELVWWGEEGIDAFDHRQAGWELQGKHRVLRCRDCHRADHVVDPSTLLAARKSLDRTFLGLRETCSTCHEDPHRQQFSPDPCTSCHGQDTFRPAVGFDHQATRFTLDGAHSDLACAQCHPPLSRDEEARPPADTGSSLEADISSGSSAGLHFRNLGRTACVDCHEDVHSGRLGTDCASCHDTATWSSARRPDFDHRRTAFPLLGRHARVACASCHGPVTSGPATLRRPSFASCADCHGDVHLGQFASSPSRGACEACHDTAGFVPSRFTVEDHASTTYPLEGRHRETRCTDCHLQVAATELAPHAEHAESVRVRRFRFASTSCPDCHADPHAGTAAPVSCGDCHDLAAWHSVAFSHRRTEFPLAGRHRGLECRACHPGQPRLSDDEALRFTVPGASCADCHADPHAGQFEEVTLTAGPAGGEIMATRCERCHEDGSFRALRFDHQLDSSYPLEGAHRTVACDACHPRVPRDGREIVRYRPLARDCSACHTGGAPRLDRPRGTR